MFHSGRISLPKKNFGTRFLISLTFLFAVLGLTLPFSSVLAQGAANAVTLTPVGQIGGIANTVTISEGLAYAGEGNSLVILNTSVIGMPVIGRLGLSGIINDLHLSGSYLYAAAGNALEIVDVSNPATPVRVTSIPFAQYYRVPGLAVSGNLVFMALWDHISVYDVSNPSSPTLMGSYDVAPLNAQANDINIVGNLAYCTCGSGGLIILDVANPAQISLRSQQYVSGKTMNVSISGSHGYVASNWSGLQIVDISNPSAPSIVGTFATHQTQDVQVVGDFAYLANYYYTGSSLQVVNISDPANPVQVGSPFPIRGDAVRLQIVNNQAFVANGSGGIEVIDITDPSHLTLVNHHYMPGNVWDLDIVGNYAYLASQLGGLFIVDITNPAQPVARGSISTNNSAYGVRVLNNMAYVANEKELLIVDISNPDNPVKRGSLALQGSPRALRAVGNRVYVASSNLGGMYIIDVSNPDAPTSLGRYQPSNGSATVDLDIIGDFVYLAEDAFGIEILNVSNPASIQMVGSLSTGSLYITSVKVIDNIAYVTTANGFLLSDVSNPALPTQIGSVYPTYAEGVVVQGAYAYVTGRGPGFGITVFDVRNPSNIAPVANLQQHGEPRMLDMVGDLIFAAATNGGMEIVRSDLNPVVNTNYPDGAPGSSFWVTGHNFPKSSAIPIELNGHPLGDAATDESGSFSVLLTTEQADTGSYTLTARTSGSAGPTLQTYAEMTVSTNFRISMNVPVRLPPEGYIGQSLLVPQGIAKNYIFLPFITR